MVDFAQARRAMVDSQLRTFDVNDFPLLTAMNAVPREHFVPAGRESLAYIDQDVPVVDGAHPRLMLSPMVLGRLIQAIEVTEGMRILDVACGLGYSSAVLSRLGADVVALESDPILAEEARARLGSVAPGVTMVTGSLDAGFTAAAPYDAILVNGSLEKRPEALLGQLADGGRLVCVQGHGRAGRATLFIRSGGSIAIRVLFDAAAPALQEFRVEQGFVF